MLDKYGIITVKGFVKRDELIREDGKVYKLLNTYALKNEIEHGYFSVMPWGGKWWMIRKIITNVEFVNNVSD